SKYKESFMARPKKLISAKAVFEMAKIGCTQEEIGRVLGCDPTTIGRRFKPELERGNTELKVSLRRRQIKSALDGNVTMLIWLGKQFLGQTDKSRTELAGEVAVPTKIEHMSAEEQQARLRELFLKGGFDAQANR